MDFEKQQQAFRTSSPSLIGRGFEKITSPVGGAVAGFGAASGIGGILTMGLDIPATIALALRCIRDTGRAYGYDGKGARERLFRLQVLELASLNDKKQRAERIAALEAGIGPDGNLSEMPPEEIDPVIEQAIERVSRALAIALFRRRVGAVVPLVGSVIGGAVNVSFQGDVGEAARFAFQERRLRAGKA